jgi:hypothetical protein
LESLHIWPPEEQHRPITAGGFVKSGPVVFEDISEKGRADHWTHKMGTPQKKYIVETNGSGVGLIDYDNDGWLDIYVVNGSTVDALDRQGDAAARSALPQQPRRNLYRCGGQGRRDQRPLGHGVAIADYDNDGWPDIFVSNWGKNRLYHNNHDGTFTDVAEKAGVQLGNWSTGATWGDYDGDGRLGPVCGRLRPLGLEQPAVRRRDGSNQRLLHLPRRAGELRAAGPEGRARPSLPQQRRRHLYRREREGRRGRQARLLRAGALFVDINNDGKIDLLVGNDSTPNYLYLNKGDGTFEDVSYAPRAMR